MTTAPTAREAEREQNYQRALRACHKVRALDTMVRLIATLGPPKKQQPMCYACIWDTALKPLARLVVGWQRGCGVEQADDPGTDLWLKARTVTLKAFIPA